MKILNVVVQSSSFEYRDNNFVLSFMAEDGVADPEAALRQAIKEFGTTEDARMDVEYACGCYNWGDFAHALADDILKKHGLTPIGTSSIDVFVDHDEVLLDEPPDNEGE